jgi:hypothetical protein
VTDIEGDVAAYFGVKPPDRPRATATASEPPPGVPVAAPVAAELARAARELGGKVASGVVDFTGVVSLTETADRLALTEAFAVLKSAFDRKTILINDPSGWRVYTKTGAAVEARPDPDGGASADIREFLANPDLSQYGRAEAD